MIFRRPHRHLDWFFGLTGLLAGFGAIISGCSAPAGKTGVIAARHDTLERQVMVGYQGWFRTPADGAGMGWAHYQQQGTENFSPGHLSIDYWPEVAELPASSRVATAFIYPDGRAADVFSSHDVQVADLHFRW